mgnify:CR=1 FL=1
MKILRDINKAKQKQADRKAHKMMSFRRPLNMVHINGIVHIILTDTQVYK